jgi:hypothetical protein
VICAESAFEKIARGETSGILENPIRALKMRREQIFSHLAARKSVLQLPDASHPAIFSLPLSRLKTGNPDTLLNLNF